MRLFYPYFFSPFHIKLFRDIVIISCLAIVKSNIFIIGQSDVSFLFLSHRMVYIYYSCLDRKYKMQNILLSFYAMEANEE